MKWVAEIIVRATHVVVEWSVVLRKLTVDFPVVMRVRTRKRLLAVANNQHAVYKPVLARSNVRIERRQSSGVQADRIRLRYRPWRWPTLLLRLCVRARDGNHKTNQQASSSR